MNGRILYSRMALIVLALAGLFDAVFLARERARQIAAEICLFENACEQLRMSEWSTIPHGSGAPVAVLGAVGFGAMIALAALGLARERLGPISIAMVLFAAASVAVIISAYLLATQLRVTSAICTRCLPSALVSLGLWIAALIGLQWRSPAATATVPSSPQPATGWAEQREL